MGNFRVAGLIVLAIALAACSVQHKDAVDGKSVQRKIDESITPLLKVYDPSLKIGRAVCEPIIVQEKGTMGTCTLTVNGVPLDIRVVGAPAPELFKVDFAGRFFFTMPYVERLTEKELADTYGVSASVNCGAPRVRLLKPDEKFSCALTGIPGHTSIDLNGTSRGQIFFPKLKGLRERNSFADVALSLHEHGKATTVKGSDVVRFAMLSSGTTGAQQKFSVVCPPVLDLTGTKHGMCNVVYLGVEKPQRLDVWIDETSGLSIRPIDAVVDRKKVERMAQDDLNRRLSDNGDKPDAAVSCDPGILVVQPPSTFDCRATADGKRYRLVVTVSDYRGNVGWKGVPIK